VKHKTRKAPRVGGPAGTGQANIRKVAGQTAKQISEADPAHQPAAGPAHDAGNTPAEKDHALADLVWKYLSEEITQAVIEVQEALAPVQSGSAQQVIQRNR
jgi:hypothetical protein